MSQVAREGDKGSESEEDKDTMDNITPPPPDSMDAEGNAIYTSPPKIQVKKVQPATGKGSKTVFCNGKGVLFAGSAFTDKVVIIYDRQFDLDASKRLIGTYKDTEVSRQTTSDIKAKEGSSTVFVEGAPIARKGDKLSRGEINEGSDDVYAN